MKNVMKKIGWTIVAFLPIPAYFLLQVVVIMVAEVVMVVPLIMKNPSAQGLEVEIYRMAMDNIMLLQIVAQIATLLVFGAWYYFAYGRKRRPETAQKPESGHIVRLVLLGLILQFGISSVLSIVESLAPKLLESYNELMELAGLGEMSLPVLIATTIMAPLSEEVLCRGVILRLAEKVSPKFWVANVIQALAFGILHGNWVQGIYAFALGLILGYIYGKFRNIWLCMLLHGAMNLSSFLVNPFYSLFSEKTSAIVFYVVFVISAVLFVLCFMPFVAKKQNVR